MVSTLVFLGPKIVLQRSPSINGRRRNDAFRKGTFRAGVRAKYGLDGGRSGWRTVSERQSVFELLEGEVWLEVEKRQGSHWEEA